MKIKKRAKDSVSVSVGIFVPTGSAFETQEEQGLAHFIEHMLFKGTKSRTYKQIAADIDRIGGVINAFTSAEYTGFYIKVPSDYLKEGYAVLSDIVKNSLIDERELEKEKQVIVEEINMVEDNPDEAVYEAFIKNAIDGSYGKSILGSKEKVLSYRREDLLKFMGRFYKPENMVISAVGGGVDDFDFELKGEFFFDTYREDYSFKPTFSFKKGVDVIKRGTFQMNVVMGQELFDIYDERKYAAYILNDSFGGMMSARLFQSIREDKSLCYNIYSSVRLFKKGGMFLISAATSNDKAQRLIDAIREELINLKKNGLKKEEIEDAKTHFAGSYAIGLESNYAVMVKQAVDTITYGDYVDEREILDKIKSVKMEDVEEIIDLINLDNFHITCLGKIDSITW